MHTPGLDRLVSDTRVHFLHGRKSDSLTVPDEMQGLNGMELRECITEQYKALQEKREDKLKELKFLEYLLDRLWTSTAAVLSQYTDLEIAQVFMDLYQMNEEEFDGAGFTELDMPINKHDCPKTYLLDLVQDLVVARLLKERSVELVRACE